MTTTADAPLRWRLAWQLGGLVLITAVVLASVVPPFSIWAAQGEDKLMHALAYLVLSSYYAGVVRPKRYALVALGLLGLGIALEFLQRELGYRIADPWDVAANAMGIALGLVAGLLGLSGWARAIERRYHSGP